jgi:chromosomal replication initiator protein|tara:strand:+ start:10019 stop:11326 length:1308 start_codon:yes stop_codon:yes gene_type:complete
LNFCEKELSKQQYTTWIKPLSGDVDEKLKQLTISAPNQFVLQWVKERLNDKLHSLLEESSNISSITYNVNKKTKRSLSVEAIITESPDPNKIKPVKTNGLNKSFNFDNFVTGKANQLACAAAKQIAEKPGTTYNPLFVYGGVGLGKTHLMHAIGNHLKSIQPNAKIKYLHAERYVHDVVKAYENKDFDSFKKNYHSLDLLLIDDIQFIAKKNRTQEEFFYAFNTLIENKKQIIITCDSYPKEIVGVDERLRTRFSWGLTVSIDPPELEMRVAILLKKAAGNKIQLSEEVAFFVAKQIRSNVRELEGALNRIVAMSNFTGREIDLSLAKESLKDLIAVRGRQISVENIQKTVADFYKIKIADIHSKKRSRNYSRPRQIAMSLTRELTNLSFPEIGEAFGGRHHTTIMHACDEIESLRLSDQAIGQDLGFLTQVLKG